MKERSSYPSPSHEEQIDTAAKAIAELATEVGALEARNAILAGHRDAWRRRAFTLQNALLQIANGAPASKSGTPRQIARWAIEAFLADEQVRNAPVDDSTDNGR